MKLKYGIYALCLLAGLTGCEMQLGGKSISEAFTDPQVAELVRASVRGDVEKMEALVKSGVPVDAKGYGGSSALVWTIAAHNNRGIKKLLELGADPNQPIVDTYSSVTFYAAGGDNPEALDLLLSYGGDPNVRGGGERTL